MNVIKYVAIYEEKTNQRESTAHINGRRLMDSMEMETDFKRWLSG